MALSRIWSAFIIVAILVAGIQFLAGGQKQIFSSMVVGKKGDSVQVKEMPVSAAEPSLVAALDTVGRVKQGELIYRKEEGMVKAVKVQAANGIIDTCWDAVDLCLKLIGVLALFIGFMSIAERAGGINLLSRIIGPFFSRLFPEVPSGHPAM